MTSSQLPDPRFEKCKVDSHSTQSLRLGCGEKRPDVRGLTACPLFVLVIIYYSFWETNIISVVLFWRFLFEQ